MKNVIIGTAGHVDHGKTCLIKALSGIDTDRLKEEKQRGITIELGFADLPNDMDMDIGIIDVPGHEKFVRHMLAGIGGIDVVLLVIAADEGIMPQTVEHFEILKMLHIRHGIIVLTKVDMVDNDWIEMVEEEVKSHVKGSFLEEAPIVKVSSHTGENIEQLRELILEKAKECGVRREKKELFRLPADRVFTVDGFGTVITGTLMEGSVEKGDEVMIYPSKKLAKVRNLQVHGENVDRAASGQRTAINLTGIKKEEIKRGDVVTWPELLETTMILDVKIDMFDDTDRVLKNGSRIHFYYGSAEALCKVVLLSDEVLEKGSTGYAQLRFEEEIAVKRGDRFVLRFYSPMETIGGGTILNAAPRKRKRYDDRALDYMRIQDEGDEEQVMELLFLEEGTKLTDSESVIKKMGKLKEEVDGCFKKLSDKEQIIAISDTVALHRNTMEEIEEKAKRMLDLYHENNPISVGMQKEEFRSKVKTIIACSDIKKIESLIGTLISRGTIKESDGTIASVDFNVEYTPEQKKLADLIEKTYKHAGYQLPEIGDVLKLSKNGKLVQQMVDALCSEGKLHKLNYQYYMHSSWFVKAIDMLQETLKANGKITLAEFRDLIGTSRKYAMIILDYADECKITKMEGEHRVLIMEGKWISNK